MNSVDYTIHAEPETRTLCRELVADHRRRKTPRRSEDRYQTRRNREFLIVLLVFAAVTFSAGYALGTYDGAQHAVNIITGGGR